MFDRSLPGFLHEEIEDLYSSSRVDTSGGSILIV